MDEQAQRIAIAESQGWKWYRIPHSEKHSRGPLKSLFLPAIHEIDQDSIWLQPGQDSDRIANPDYMAKEGLVPDYLNDLNAMFEVEKAMTDEQYTDFHYHLTEVRNNDCMPVCRCASATAKQRAEAYLRAIGRWQETAKAAA